MGVNTIYILSSDSSCHSYYKDSGRGIISPLLTNDIYGHVYNGLTLYSIVRFRPNQNSSSILRNIKHLLMPNLTPSTVSGSVLLDFNLHLISCQEDYISYIFIFIFYFFIFLEV